MIEILLCAATVSWCTPSPAQPETNDRAMLYSSPCESPETMLSEHFWFGGKWGDRDVCWRNHLGTPVIATSNGAKPRPTPKPMQCKVMLCTPTKADK